MAESNTVEMRLVCTPQGFELFDQAGKKVGELGRAAIDAGKQADAGFSMFNAKLGAGVVALGGLLAGVLSAKAALESLGAAVERGAGFADLAAKTGASVEALSSIDLAARTASVGLDQLAAGLGVLGRNMAAARAGNDDAAAAFKRVGISISELGDDPLKAFELLAAKLDGMPDGAAKVLAGTELMGRGFQQFLPLLAEGPEGLERFRRISEVFGLTISGEVAAGLDAFSDNLTILGTVTEGLSQRFVAGLAPALEGLTKTLIDFAVETGTGATQAEEFGETVGEALTKGVSAGLGAIDTFLTALNAVGLDGVLLNVFEGAFNAVEAKATAAGKRILANLLEEFTGGPPIPILGDLFSLDADVAGLREAAAAADDVAAGFLSGIGQNSPGVLAARDAVRNLKNQIDETIPSLQFGRSVTDDFYASIVDLGEAPPLAPGPSEEARKLGEELTKQAAALSAVQAIYGQAASGAITLAEAEQHAAAASAVLSKGVANETALQAALAIERQKAAVELTKGIASTNAANAATDAQIAILEDAVAAGTDYEEAQRQITEAAINRQAATLAATTGDAAQAEAWRQSQIAALGYKDQVEDLNATLQAQDRLGDLQSEVAIWQEVEAGALSVADAQRLIAVNALEAQGVLRSVAEQTVATQEKLRELQSGDGWIELGDVIKDSIGQVFDGLIAGTLELEDAAKSLGLAFGKQWVEGILDAKFKDLDPKVRANFFDLADEGEGIFGGMFKNVASDFQGVGSLGYTGPAAGDYAGGAPFGSIGADPTNYVELGSAGVDYAGSPGTSGFRGQSWSQTGLDAVGGAAAGYGTFSALNPLGPGSTGLDGLIAKGAEEGINNSLTDFFGAMSTVVGAVLSIWLGPLGGTVAGAVGAVLSGLWADSIDRDTLRTGDFDGFAEFQKWFDPLAFGLTTLFLDLPTLGTAFRRAGESALDASKTFGGEDGTGGLQALLGDYTRSGESNQRGPEIAMERGLSQGQVDTIMGGTGSIFSQMAEGELPEDAGRFAEAMGRTMSEFLSRGLAEGMSYDDMIASLRSFAEESGVTLQSSMRNLPNVLEQSKAAAMEFGKLDPFAASEQAADAYAQNVLGIAAIFEGDFPAGVHLASIALQTMEKDGARAFDSLDSSGKATLTNLTQDATLLQDVMAHLVEQGFTIDTQDFLNAVADISASAGFIGENISAVFSGPSVTAGIAAMGEQLKAQITAAVGSEGLSQLFDTTNIGASFEPVYATLRQLKEGAFDSQGGVGGDAFKSQIAAAIAEGDASLEEFIPQLRAIRDAAEEVNKAIDEALKPTDAEQFWITLEETIKANRDAIDGMAASLFDVAANAEALMPGSGRDAARGAMDQIVDQSAFNAATAAAGDFATKSPQGEELAQLTAQFQFKVAAAFQDGVISAEEKLDLARLKAKMDEAGQVLADSVSKGTEGLSDLFRADRLKEAIESAQESLKGSLGGAAGSMFDVISGGGSTAEGIEAFGESFRGSVRDNVLQGMQEALVQSAIMDGAVGTLTGQLKQAVSVALEDGFIDADEQAFIDGLAKGIGTATDATLNALQPTLETLGGIAQTVSGNTEEAEVKIGKLDESTKNASYGVDEMARRAAKSLEDVGAAVPPDVAASIRAGMGALGDAVGGVGDGPAAAIKSGVGALSDAFGGAAGSGAAAISGGITALSDAFGAVVDGSADLIGEGVTALAGAFGNEGAPDEIKAGLSALRDAFGPEVGTDAMKATLEKLKSTFGPDISTPIEAGLGALRDAFGPGGGGASDGLLTAAEQLAASFGGGATAGLAGTAEALRMVLGEGAGVTGAASELAAKLQDELGASTDDVAGRLRDGFSSGLGIAEDAARRLAEALNGIAVTGAATGGSFASGAAVVGEAGEPELVVARQGGGFDVIPLDRATAAALMGGGVPGFEDGGTIIGPGGGGVSGGGGGPMLIPIGGGGTGPFGRPRVPPPPAPRRPTTDGDDADAPELLVSISFDQAISDFIGGGSSEELSEALRKSAGEGVLEGMKAALIESIAFEEFNQKLSDATREAMSDGVISAREASDLGDMAEEFAAGAEEAIVAMGPAFDHVAERFGLRTQEEVVDAITTATTTAGELIGGSLRGLLSDPSALNIEAFTQNLRGSIYQNVAGGLIDAFVESAVTQGALAPMLAAISGIFDQIGQKQLTVAEANGLIAEQMAAINGVLIDPAFTASIETLLAGVKGIGDGIGAFAPVAQEFTRDLGGVSDAFTEAQEDVCDGKCAMTKELVDMGPAVLDEYGRAGYEQIERMVPAYGAGGIVRHPTVALVGERPEAIVPLEALEGILGAGLSPDLVQALQAARGPIDGLMPLGASSSLESMHSAMRDVQFRPDMTADMLRGFSGGTGGGDHETKALLREVLGELRAGRETGGASFDRLADAIERQPIVLEGKVNLDGKELTKSTLEQLRRQSRGGQSVTRGVS